ncbi:hypothetical protein PEPS_12960 [Persicobacter psychrovividus]|uniref:Transposase n=1 Tax=Persicobacter psychrovividus TaxID=387638 RepID=A0ABN6L7N5_9BACT|nr:hypothetical protein PEPS_12960 [Persicobacter psychrovividus]
MSVRNSYFNDDYGRTRGFARTYHDKILCVNIKLRLCNYA